MRRDLRSAKEEVDDLRQKFRRGFVSFNDDQRCEHRMRTWRIVNFSNLSNAIQALSNEKTIFH